MTRFRKGLVVAHRGGAGEAPENTLQAFSRAITLGYPAVECDVRRSRDGVPVVVHDAKIERRGARIPVADLDAADSGLPTLDAFLALPFQGTVLMIEVKPTAHDAELGAAVARAIRRSGRAGHAFVASFSPAVLEGARSAEPDVGLMGLLDSADGAAAFASIPVFAWGVDLALVDAARVAAWRQGGREVWTWTVRDGAGFERAKSAGVDAYIADFPGEVLRMA